MKCIENESPYINPAAHGPAVSFGLLNDSETGPMLRFISRFGLEEGPAFQGCEMVSMYSGKTVTVRA